MNSHIIGRLVLFIIFRLIHLLLLFESDVYALVLRLLDSKLKNDEVEIFNIFARFRFDATDVTKESDFLSFHEKTSLFEEVCEEGWFIYSINENYVYLVKIPPEEDESYDSMVSIEKHSKVASYLFEKAEKLARIDLETFERVSRTLPDFKGKVIVIYSAPCGGGTIAGKLIQVCDDSKQSLLVIGEPPFLSSLSLLYNTMPIENMRKVTKSSLLYSMLHQKPGQTVVIKSRPSCTKIVPYIYSGCPSIKHVFIAKKSYNDVISRLVIYTSTQIPVFSFICWLLSHSKQLVDTLTSWRNLEEELISKIGPTTDVEFAVGQVYGCLVNYQRNRKYFAMDSLVIDELISDTAVKVRPLLNLCDISDLAIPECIEWKRNAEEILKTVWDTVELTKEDSSRVAYLIDLIQQDCFMP